MRTKKSPDASAGSWKDVMLRPLLAAAARAFAQIRISRSSSASVMRAPRGDTA